MDKQFPIQLASAVYKVTELFPENEPLRYKTREIADEILADFAVFQNLEIQDLDTEQGFLQRNRVKNQIFSKIEILNNYYFDLAREQAWVNPCNFLILKREYDKMKSDIETRLSQIELPASTAALQRAKPETNDESSVINNHLSIINDEPEPEIEPEIEPEPEPILPTQDLAEPEPEFSKIIEPEPPVPVIAREPYSATAAISPEKTSKPEQKELSPRHQEILKIIEQGGKKQVGELRKSFPALSKRTLRRDLEFLLKQGFVKRLGQWNEVSYRIKNP